VISRELGKVVFYIVVFMQGGYSLPKSLGKSDGSLFLKELFAEIIPMSLETIFKPLLEVFNDETPKRVPTKLVGTNFFDVPKNSAHRAWHHSFNKLLNLPQCQSMDLVNAYALVLERFWSSTTQHVMQIWPMMANQYASILVHRRTGNVNYDPCVTDKMLYLDSPERTTWHYFAEHPVHNVDLSHLMEPLLLRGLNMVQNQPNNVFALFGNCKSDQYLEVVKQWCKPYANGDVLLAMKQLAQVIHCQILNNFVHGSTNSNAESSLVVALCLDDPSLLHWIHNYFFYGPTTKDAQNKGTQDENFYFDRARFDILSQQGHEGKFSNLLDLVFSHGIFNYYISFSLLLFIILRFARSFNSHPHPRCHQELQVDA